MPKHPVPFRNSFRFNINRWHNILALLLVFGEAADGWCTLVPLLKMRSRVWRVVNRQKSSLTSTYRHSWRGMGVGVSGLRAEASARPTVGKRDWVQVWKAVNKAAPPTLAWCPVWHYVTVPQPLMRIAVTLGPRASMYPTSERERERAVRMGEWKCAHWGLWGRQSKNWMRERGRDRESLSPLSCGNSKTWLGSHLHLLVDSHFR